MSEVPVSLREPWAKFIARVEARLEAGAKEYGDGSLRAAPAKLAGEIEEELLDVMGWGFLLWLRMRGLSKKVSEL